MSDPDLPVLVKQAQSGDRAAFERIVHTTARIVYAQIASMVHDRQRAEDLTQETFVAAWKAIRTLQAPEGFVSWLLTLARNTTLDAIKREGRLKRQGNRTAAGEGAAAEMPDRRPLPPDAEPG